MGSRLDRHLAALCLPMDPDRLLDDLEPVDGTSTGSSYTEAGPRPGTATPEDDTTKLAPVVSGGLGSAIEIVAVQGGLPLLADLGCEVGWRYSAGADLTTRGWSAPVWLSGCWPILAPSAPDTQCDVTTIPGSQRVVCAIAYSDRVYVRTHLPGTPGWETAVQVHYEAGVTPEGVSVLALPSGRVLLIVGLTAVRSTIYRSDDEGVTWELHARNTYEPQNAFRVRSAEARGSILLQAERYQIASSDELASTVLVDSTTLASVSEWDVVGLPDGRFVVGYIAPAASDYPTVRVLASAYQPLSDATAITVDSTNKASELALVVEPDGLLWLYAADKTTPGLIRAYFSVDGGTTWTAMRDAAVDLCSTAADYVTNLSATAAAGAIFLVGEAVGSTSGADEPLCMRLGGWETVSTRSGYAFADLENRLGSESGSYIPIEYPDNTGQWTRSTTGTPTESLVADGYAIVTDSAGTDTLTFSRNIGTLTEWTEEIGVRLDTGGSSSADDVYVVVRVADNATVDYRLKARLYTSGGTTWINTRDPNAGTPSKSSDDTGITSGNLVRIKMHIEVAADLASAIGYLWVCGEEDTVWTLLWTGALTVAGSPAANGVVEFGNGATPSSGTAESYWSYLGGHTVGYLAEIGAGITTTSNYGVAGRPIGGGSVPLHPELADGDGLVPWVRVTGGGQLGEVWDVPLEHDYPVTSVLPTVSPSPAEQWRSTQNVVAEYIAWDADDETWIGDSIALVALGCNFQTAYLEYYNGAAWVTSGTLDLATGFDGLDYSISGDCLTPGTSTDSGARYLQEGELAGGFAILSVDGGGGTQAFKIRWNTAGSWISAGQGTPRVRILLDGDLSGVDATGACTLVWPSGICVVHLNALLRARRWRVRIPAQDCPDDHWRAGVLVPMAVRAIGQAPAWGWSRETAPNTETRRSRYGTSRVRQLGPPVTSVTWGWTDGVMLDVIRDTTAPDYLGSSVGLPLIATGDVPWLLRGLLERAQGGAVPVVALSHVPDASGTTITDRTLWLYGRLTGSVREDNVSGTEGESELQRVASITVEGLV